MLFRAYIFIFIFCFYFCIAEIRENLLKNAVLTERPKYPENFKQLESLKEFVKLIDEYHMNVSIIVSKTKHWKNGNIKKTIARTLTFPVNSISLNETTVSYTQFRSYAAIATKDKLVVRGTIAENGEEFSGTTNCFQGVPDSKAHKIFSGLKNGKSGFVFDEENYAAQYTFIKPDAKKPFIKVHYVDVDIEVIDHQNLTNIELDAMKQALVDTYFTYNLKNLSKAISTALTKKLPENNWSVAINVGLNSYLDSTKWASLKILKKNILIYNI